MLMSETLKLTNSQQMNKQLYWIVHVCRWNWVYVLQFVSTESAQRVGYFNFLFVSTGCTINHGPDKQWRICSQWCRVIKLSSRWYEALLRCRLELSYRCRSWSSVTAVVPEAQLPLPFLELSYRCRSCSSVTAAVPRAQLPLPFLELSYRCRS